MLIDSAPWLPPNTSAVGSLLFICNSSLILLFCSSVKLILFIFVGVPVTTIFLAFGNLFLASSNPTSTVFTFLDKTLTATPGKALLSCINVGMQYLKAFENTGPHMYPPVPITISGFISFIIFFAVL